MGGPTICYTDTTGSAYFGNTISGIYELKWTNSDANNMSIYKDYNETIIYIYVPELSGLTVDAFTLQISASNNTFNGTVCMRFLLPTL